MNSLPWIEYNPKFENLQVVVEMPRRMEHTYQMLPLNEKHTRNYNLGHEIDSLKKFELFLLIVTVYKGTSLASLNRLDSVILGFVDPLTTT